MAEGLQLTMGAEASCSDGVCGEVDRLIVNPETMVLTHIGVEPKHGQLAGRLVPIELVDTSTSDTNLLCTLADFENLGAAEEEHPQPPLPSLPFEKDSPALDPQYAGMHDRFGLPCRSRPSPSPTTFSPRVPWRSAEAAKSLPRTAPSGSSRPL